MAVLAMLYALITPKVVVTIEAYFSLCANLLARYP